MTSGSGTTVKYIADKFSNNFDIELVGVVMEDNPQSFELEHNIQDKLNLQYRLRVNEKQFNYKNEYYNYIYENIKGLEINYIVLAGWMKIINQDFINKMSSIGCKIINLHPSLQYQLIGKEIYYKIWNMFEEGMITKTGAMVHYIDTEIDRGTIITEEVLDLKQCTSFEDYKDKMYNYNGVEKRCLYNAILKLFEEFKKPIIQDITPLNFSNIELKLLHRGKVRDIYESRYYNDLLFINTSDRISANDIVISYIRGKGVLLNQINYFWQKLFGLDQVINISENGQMMVVKKLRPIPLEIIIRRKLYGSLWKEYQKGLRVINGYHLNDDMKEGEEFQEPIITPTTKGIKDKPITFNEILEWGVLNKRELDIICEMSINLFKQAENYMKYLGIEMIDTKFELGFDQKGNIHFIDEIFTPDSSRFIINGKKMDKDILRKYANDNLDFILSHYTLSDGCRNVILPEQVSNQLFNNYLGFYNIIKCGKVTTQFDNFFTMSNMYNNIVIIAGSKTDYQWVNKIRDELKKVNLIAFVYYSSAHKNTKTVIDILQYFENKSRVIYITVAGMSNALSGVISANTKHPVIACPPLTDKNDYMVNINSTLQMPSSVPSCTILRPDNVASFCQKILFTTNI